MVNMKCPSTELEPFSQPLQLGVMADSVSTINASGMYLQELTVPLRQSWPNACSLKGAMLQLRVNNACANVCEPSVRRFFFVVFSSHVLLKFTLSLSSKSRSGCSYC